MRRLRVLLMDERGDGRKVITHIISDTVMPIGAVTWRQAMPAHLGQPDIQPGTRQEGRQANATRRQPETPIGKTAMQQHHWLATAGLLTRQANTGQRQRHAGVGTIARLEQVDIFSQVAAQLGAVQGDRKQGTATLHDQIQEGMRHAASPLHL